MVKQLSLILILAFFALVLNAQEDSETLEVSRIEVNNYTWKENRVSTNQANHSSFEILNNEFENAHEVTEACLSCHTKRDEEIMATSHWNWERSEMLEGKGAVPVGKKNILNNFCIGVAGSEASCMRCHIGYGWKDQSFDFDEP